MSILVLNSRHTPQSNKRMPSGLKGSKEVFRRRGGRRNLGQLPWGAANGKGKEKDNYSGF